jgi:hypothetical protein
MSHLYLSRSHLILTHGVVICYRARALRRYLICFGVSKCALFGTARRQLPVDATTSLNTQRSSARPDNVNVICPLAVAYHHVLSACHCVRILPAGYKILLHSRDQVYFAKKGAYVKGSSHPVHLNNNAAGQACSVARRVAS